MRPGSRPATDRRLIPTLRASVEAPFQAHPLACCSAYRTIDAGTRTRGKHDLPQLPLL